MLNRECFYSSVKNGTAGDDGKKLDGHISDEDSLTCKKIWKEFGMKNMGDYHDRYLIVFEKFIDTSLEFYRLHPCHYFSSPELSWDAMLKMTGVKLEKISKVDMYLLIEKGLREGISCIAKRYAKANNNYM